MQENVDIRIEAATPQQVNSAQNLRSEAFSTPEQFLKTLHDSFDQIAHGEQYLTKVDLTNAAANESNDSLARASASVAANHYDQLQQMAIIDPKIDAHSGISKYDLNQDLFYFESDSPLGERIALGLDTLLPGIIPYFKGIATFKYPSETITKEQEIKTEFGTWPEIRRPLPFTDSE